MEDTYQLGPVAISKSFVKQPLFWLVLVVGLILIMGVIANRTGRLSIAIKPASPAIMAKVFPLTERFNKQLIYSSGTGIFRTDGQSEEKLFEVGNEVYSLVLSNDGSKLAATYKLPSGGLNAAGYPYSSLIFYDMNTRRSLPLIAKERTTVRYPQWSDDNRYVSFWVNEGEESFIYDTSRRKAIYSVKREGSTAVSPIVFLPGSTGIVYIKNGTVYSAAIDGSRPISLAEQAAATRSVDGGTLVATPPVVSSNGNYLAYYTFTGDLNVVNTTTREIKTVESKVTSLGFLSNEELLYKLDGEDNILYRYSVADASSTKITIQKNFLSSGVSSKGAVLLNRNSQFYLPSVYPNQGPQLVNKDGTVQQDCSKANFNYKYNNSSNDTSFAKPIEVASTDGKYLVGTSDGSLTVLDVATCQPYIISESKVSATTWTP